MNSCMKKNYETNKKLVRIYAGKLMNKIDK